MGQDFGVVKVNSATSAASKASKDRQGNSKVEKNRAPRESFRSQFVYASVTPWSTRESSAVPDSPSIFQKQTDSRREEIEGNSELSVTKEEIGPWEPSSVQTLKSCPELHPLSTRFRNLLGYFQFQMSRSFSCHEGIQHSICSTLIPMAVSSPHLMAAMLCAAASHRLSVGLEQSLDDVVRLRSIAIQRLNFALASSDHHDSITALGTSLVLCMSEIVSPEATGGDWRVHLSGSSALLQRLDGLSRHTASSMQFMRRFYSSLKVIAAGCGTGDVRHLFDEDSDKDNDYIDDLAGFSTKPVPIFESISSMDRDIENHTSLFGASTFDFLSASLFPQYLQLIDQVQTMRALRRLKFRPELKDSLSANTQTDFGLLDEAHHHMALLQLYERVDSLAGPVSSHSAQESVKRIIACIGGMDIAARPCPGVATLPPLFAAGCAAANSQDRNQILGLLLHVRACFGMGNVTSTSRFLEARWRLCKTGGFLIRQSVDDLGFLPY
ncbi:hypothetical protein G7046_g816 [Stylonectria norvegica]|nr:hypothetical protein G7046_g816 [Stylonectria norvegica]